METDMKRRDANEQVLRRFFRYMNDRDYEAALELMADDLLWEMPFAPPAIPAPFELARFKKLLRGFAMVFSEGPTFDDLNIQPMLDPDRFVIEFRGEGVVAATGQPYRQRYVEFYQLSEGRIVNVREYFDSAVAIRALGWPTG